MYNPFTLSRFALLALFSLLLISCGGKGVVKPEESAKPAPAQTAETPQKPGTKPGGYYLDDGPGENPPPNIDGIPDAVPRPEILLARANLPYSALGERYIPMTSYKPYKERGIASWYGKRYHGRKTSSGEIYDMYGMTGAHPTLPIPSYARVTNPENGRSVIVRINDRGPFQKGRLIDLSYAAAYKLRLVQHGSGLVEVEAIDASNSSMLRAKGPDEVEPGPAQIETAQVEPPPAVPQPTKLEGSATAAAPAAEATDAAAPEGGDYVQVGAFKFKPNAESLINKLKKQNLAENVPVQSWYNEGTYRVRLGPYASRQEAESAAAAIRRVLKTSAILIRQ
ncbi:MAG TPA: septal ring lytic transglycosylase RlpA family protein [Methylophilaceae bacterium]|nr:septal ring lytic transglycosylase RlpA family protein [Methylophilaceae bacterium]